MKILHVSYAKAWGGGEQQTLSLLMNLNNVNSECLNYILCPEDSVMAEKCKQLNIPAFHLPVKTKLMQRISLFKSIVKEISPDIVHINTGRFLLDFLFFTKLNKVSFKTVFTMNGMVKKKSFFSKQKYNNSKIAKYLCVSKVVEENLRKNVLFKKNYNKTVVVYDGINIQSQQKIVNIKEDYSLPQNSVIIGNVANHTGAKSLNVLLEVANELVNKRGNSNFYFLQIGKFSGETVQHKEYIKQKGLEKNFLFLGFRENVREFYGAFDYYMMSSNREGIPLTIFEAVLNKKPVVTTNAGGIPEFITDNETGIMCNIDNVEGLADGVIKLIANPKLRQKIIENAYKKLVTLHDEKVNALNVIDLYKSL